MIGPHVDMTRRLADLFAQQRYAELVTVDVPENALTSEGVRMIGQAHLRLGNPGAALPWLARAAQAQDPEGSVEYAFALEWTGQAREAAALLRGLIPTLQGELLFQALRGLGQALAGQGDVEGGLEYIDRARYGYLALADRVKAADVAATKAEVQLSMGRWTAAGETLKEALSMSAPDPDVRMKVFTGMIGVCLADSRWDEARTFMQLGEELLEQVGASTWMRYLARRHEVQERQAAPGSSPDIQPVHELYAYALQVRDCSLLRWAALKRVAHRMNLGQGAQALATLVEVKRLLPEFPVELGLAKASAHRHLGDLDSAVAELEALRATHRPPGPTRHYITVRLNLSFAYHLQQQFERALPPLREAMDGLSGTDASWAQPLLGEMSDLLQAAALTPELTPVIAAVLNTLDGPAGRAEVEPRDEVRVRVVTLGDVQILVNGAPVTLMMRGSAALLTLLYERPGLTVAELAALLLPGKEDSTARAYVRQSVRELRDYLGRDGIVTEGHHNRPGYRLGRSVRLELDLQRFTDAIERGEVARALALYRGDFMPGFDESGWVLSRREEARLALTFETRRQIRRAAEVRDWRRMILLANQHLRIEPDDLEVHQQRVDAALLEATPSELAQYVAQFRDVRR